MKEKILIAIGDVVLTNLLEQKLKQEGYRPYVAIDGIDALEKMKELKPDLAIIDIIISGKNGYEVLNEKSYDKLITKIPVIIVSNSGIAVEMHRIPSNPTIKEFIIKSHIEPDEVMDKIRKVLGRDSEERIVSNVNKKKILWVEDDKLLISILSRKFENSSFVLYMARSGNEAFKILSNETPDIIILDIFLPEMNGLDVLQKIRMDEKNRKIPVIILSNISKQSDIDKAKLLGVQKFIVKSAVSLDEIISEVVSILNTKK